jgi:transcriptional/translational regulatory protein YebC/TACO1
MMRVSGNRQRKATRILKVFAEDGGNLSQTVT